ncbi:hypothetical protein PCI56_07705 [Plesiomonas shigelloides subsp. oncorhynchi]|nr:hypothetical protein [Plesiomonas shigelloides]
MKIVTCTIVVAATPAPAVAHLQRMLRPKAAILPEQFSVLSGVSIPLISNPDVYGQR